MTGNSKEQDPSIFSDPAVQPVYPPQTILVRWKDELLLLDAWDPHGVSDCTLQGDTGKADCVHLPIARIAYTSFAHQRSTRSL
jgi:hypothetical protein